MRLSLSSHSRTRCKAQVPRDADSGLRENFKLIIPPSPHRVPLLGREECDPRIFLRCLRSVDLLQHFLTLKDCRNTE